MHNTTAFFAAAKHAADTQQQRLQLVTFLLILSLQTLDWNHSIKAPGLILIKAAPAFFSSHLSVDARNKTLSVCERWNRPMLIQKDRLGRPTRPLTMAPLLYSYVIVWKLFNCVQSKWTFYPVNKQPKMSLLFMLCCLVLAAFVWLPLHTF